MFSSLKKSFDIVKDNPFITLYFVIYLIILFLIIPFVALGRNQITAMVIIVLFLLLTCAFFAGWFGMIKCAIRLYQKEEKTIEQKTKELIELKDSFFASVSTYIFPVICGFIVFAGIIYGLAYLSDFLFGNVDEVISNFSRFASDTEALKNYILSVPKKVWVTIFENGIFSYLSCTLCILFGLFWASSLYLNEKNSTNPISAFLDMLRVIFKKFKGFIVAFLLLVVINFALVCLQLFFLENVIISFIAMALRIYFAAYIIVLVFNLYEHKNPNCDNRPDGVRENEACN